MLEFLLIAASQELNLSDEQYRDIKGKLLALESTNHSNQPQKKLDNNNSTLGNLSRTLSPLKLCVILLSFSFSAFGQIEVHEEPMHHPVFENKIARVLDVVAQPGDTSLLHQHRSNYCYITIQGGQVWLQEDGGEGRNLNLYTGFIGGYYQNPDKPLVHRFANRSAEQIRLIAIENISPTGNHFDTLVHKMVNEEILINNAWFSLSKILVTSNSRTTILAKRPAVIVNLESKSLQFKTERDAGQLNQWIWLDSNKRASIINAKDDNATVVLVQLKKAKPNSRK